MEVLLPYEAVLPESEEHALNVLSMAAAVLRGDVDSYVARPWPIHYAADIPDAFMNDENRVDRLMAAINAAMDGNIDITRAYMTRTLMQHVESELAEETANRTFEPID